MFLNHKMDYLMITQIAITIIVAIVMMFWIGRLFSLSTTRYFVGLAVTVVMLNAFVQFAKGIILSADTGASPPTQSTRADILKDMTMQYELPGRPAAARAKSETQNRESAGCPVIAL